jgi:hypothetical protein
VLLLQLVVTVGFNCCEPHREVQLHLGTPGPEHMPERLPDRMSEHMPNRTECQNRCRKECQKACQKECQNIYIFILLLYIYIYCTYMPCIWILYDVSETNYVRTVCQGGDHSK